MPYFFYYLLKVTICSAVLFAYYHLFLRNKVYHAYNRFYLLAASFISLIAPLLNFELLFSNDKAATAPIHLLQVVNSSDAYLEEVIIYQHRHHISSVMLGGLAYGFISLVLLIGLIKVWLHIYGIIRQNKAKRLNDIVFIESNAKGTPFSFFQYIFWNNAIDIDSTNGMRILKHELAHVKEKHSFDKLYINVLLIFFWINPVFWFIKKELHLIHEFIADKKAIEDNDAGALAAMIIQSAYPHHSYLLSNHFFYSPIKRRLKMLTKYNHTKTGYWYRILALPLILFVIALLTIKAKSGIDELINPKEKITVVIDAGHGGTDGGATGADKKTMEKELNLALLKKIKELNTASNINLVFTRETDIYQSPQEKAAIAKAAGAELFISLHAMSNNGNPQMEHSGMEVFVAKDNYANSIASKLFASAVIGQFKSNYALKVADAPKQQSVGIYVLQSLNCPSVLIEAGYMNNLSDLQYLQTEHGQTVFAKNVLAAIAQFAANKEEYPVVAIDTIPAPEPLDMGTYKGEKITGISVSSRQKIEKITLTLASGKKVALTADEAAKEGIKLPPPPPAPPAPPVPPAVPSPPVPPTPPSPLSEVVVTGYPTANSNQIPLNTNASQQTAFFSSYNDQRYAQDQLKRPVYVLEGKELSYEQLKNLDGSQIKSVNVIKPGSDFAKLYSKKAAENGMIEIFLRGDIKMEKNEQGQDIFIADKAIIRDKGKSVLYLGVQNILLISGTSENAIPVLSDESTAKGIITNNAGRWAIRFSNTGTAFITLMSSDGKTKLGKYYFSVERLNENTRDYNNFITTLAVNDITFTRVEQEASFPGGVEAWKQYLQTNLNASAPIDEGWAQGTFQVIVKFTVDKNGSISNISTDNYKGSKTAQACIDVIRKGPKWIPGRQNGQTVKSIRRQPITFVVQEQ